MHHPSESSLDKMAKEEVLKLLRPLFCIMKFSHVIFTPPSLPKRSSGPRIGDCVKDKIALIIIRRQEELDTQTQNDLNDDHKDRGGKKKKKKTDQDVLELDITVNETLGMQKADGLDNVEGNTEPGLPREASLEGNVEVTGQTLHDEEDGRRAAAARPVSVINNGSAQGDDPIVLRHTPVIFFSVPTHRRN